MARRIVRTVIQFAILSVALVTFIIFLDTRYSVLPQAIHNRLPVHHPGFIVTDITYQSCSNLNVLSSCTLGEPWFRIEKDVFLSKSFLSKGYVFVKRIKEEEFDASKGDRAVVAVHQGKRPPQPEEPSSSSSSGSDADTSSTWESRPGGIWLKRVLKPTHAQTVNAVDVLFGADAVEPRIGWELAPQSMSVGEEPRISVRRGEQKKVDTPVLRIRKDGRFKILQVSDMHLSTGLGACRDPVPASTAASCDADPRTLEFIHRILDEEKPDLVVLSGDQVNGETAKDAQTAIFKFAELFSKAQIPYAAILGNHDDEGNLNREQYIHILSQLPYSLTRAGPELGELQANGIHEGGVGNYYIEILAERSSHSAVTLWLFDTHSYSTDRKKYGNGYDFVKEVQIKWFKETYDALKPKHSEYAYTHLDLAFIHIPLPEYRNPQNARVGEWREGVTAPSHNTGLRDALAQKNIKVVSAGHDHANDFCALDGTGGERLWLCYAGGSGFGGYGGYNEYVRRVRVWEIAAQSGTITTWKRVEWGPDLGKRVDEQTVVREGKVVNVE